MQEQIQKVAEVFKDWDTVKKPNDPQGLLLIAKKIAEVALDHMTDDLAVKSLMLAKAIADVNAELYPQD